MATIHDVARRAGVSVGTVSRVLNGHPSVRPLSRRVVFAAVEELGYHRNALARGLRSSRTLMLGLLVPVLNEMMVRVTQGAEAAAHERDYMLLLGDARDDEATQAQHLRGLLERQVDGLLCDPVASDAAVVKPVRAAGVPTVLFGQFSPHPWLPAVVSDETDAFAEALRDLADQGHQRIAFIGRQRYYSGGGHRVRLFTSLRDRLGLIRLPALVYEAESQEECRAALAAMLALPTPPTALLVGTNSFAPICLEVLHRAGMRIPADISVVISGDSAWATAYAPPLSTVAVDYFTVGRTATELLLRHIEGDETAPRLRIQTSRYIRRASCAPAPRTGNERDAP